jgi:hypothetical protein
MSIPFSGDGLYPFLAEFSGLRPLDQLPTESCLHVGAIDDSAQAQLQLTELGSTAAGENLLLL